MLHYLTQLEKKHRVHATQTDPYTAVQSDEDFLGHSDGYCCLLMNYIAFNIIL